MTNLQLTLTLDEINAVLEALGQQPYVKVFQLIGKIQQQAAEQLQHNGGPTIAADAEDPSSGASQL
jgi:hypothetical protein